MIDSPVDPEAPASGVAAFGSFTARFRALVVDLAVVAAGLVAIVMFTSVTESVPGSGRIGVAGIAALLLLYEPLTVSRLGGTVGHRRANLRVVHERTGGRPGFLRALARFALKNVFGLPSFLLMAFTRRHQALHDRVTDTTVRIHDLERARTTDVAWERAPEQPTPVGSASRVRRVVVIVAYLAVVFLAVGVIFSLLLSGACNLEGRCTTEESFTADAVSVCWVAASAYLVVAGWRGRLWGCRRRTVTPASDAPDAFGA